MSKEEKIACDTACKFAAISTVMQLARQMADEDQLDKTTYWTLLGVLSVMGERLDAEKTVVLPF